ncbi:MAG: DUF6084 family protein [Phycisphaeraceae bacterium]
MPDLSFQVQSAEPVRHAVTPTLALKLRIENAEAQQRIHTVPLQCQVRIETARRSYSAPEQSRLFDLFGEPDQWGRSLSAMLWTQTSVMVPAFIGGTTVDLPIPCTYDFNIAATRYFDSLETGDVPLCLLFSGTIFYQGQDGALQVEQVSWEKQAQFRLPVRAWKDLMQRYYPDCAWICLRKDIHDRLRQYRSQCGLPTWEEALHRLLEGADERVTP